MANISSFYGEITFPSECAEELKVFLDDYNGSMYYGVHGFDQTSAHINLMVDANEPLTVTFWGDGRWTASSTFDQFPCDAFFNPDDNPYALPLIKKLSGHTLPMTYDDYEPGCEVLYEFTGEMYIDESGNVSVFGDFNDYEYTSRNIVMLDFAYAAFDGKNNSDFEALIKLAIRRLEWTGDEALLRQTIKDKLAEPRFDNMLTEMEVDWFIDYIDDYLTLKNQCKIHIPQNQSLISFL